ncbi:sulfate permease [Halorhodospira halochloris]|uniref:Sulfate permease n=1 Tax=Halorhodospira halochloris TaxID=1052 RepID=A0A0X8XBH5_HALHR|nr:sulfate permease [Halorhodospira halochloris]MBK1652197.1 sodium-independent anion transporter [Halorhodospira halochloris]BAU58383.1 sulfate permease [Halorhodospira halochloris]
MTSRQASRRLSTARRLIPANQWQRPTPSTLKADLIAGITVALVLIPQSMAYAALAGMPAYYGLYAAFLPVMVAALWGSSPQLATGPVAVVALLTASALTPFAEPGSSEYITLAITLAMMVGLFQLLLGLFSLGTLVNFLAHPVILGFTNAAAIVIALSQVNDLLGIPMDREAGMLSGVIKVLADIGSTHLPTLLLGLAALLIMFGSRRLIPSIPGVLIAVVALTPVSYVIGYAEMGGEVVGEIPAGIPTPAMPAWDWETIRALLTTAAVIALVGFMEAISIAKALAAKTRDRIDPNQELVGQGLANIASSLSQAFPVSGSFSRSAVNHSNGARTGMSSVFTAVMVALALLVLTPLLYHLPMSVLAAIIIMAVIGLVNVKAMIHTWKTHTHDGAAALTTFVATLAFAPHLDYGIVIGAGLAIVLYLLRTMRPRVVILSRHPKDGTLRDAQLFKLPVSRHIAALRFDGPLYFANVGHLEDRTLEINHDHQEARFLLLVGDGITSIDSSGIETLHNLHQRLHDNGVTLVLAGIKLQVWEVMQRAGLDKEIGHDNIFRNEDDAIRAIHQRIDDPSFDPRSCPLRPV